MTVFERNCNEKGYRGETYVIAKLMCDFNIASVKVPQDFFSYDLITNNNKRLEIKTAFLRATATQRGNYPTYYGYGWEFRRSKKQHRKGTSDFVVCLGFQKEDFSDEPRCFIIPTKELHGFSQVFRISKISRRKATPKYHEYENKWDSIVE